MYKVSGIDDKKTEWNLNETRIIIPLANGDSLARNPDKIVRTVNLIPDNEYQSTSPGNLAHGLVIGLDKNFFEPNNTKTDLLIIHDSDLKLLSWNPDLKNQLGYSLSFVDQNKSETFWENLGPKDKPKEWSHDNAILEVKDILIFNEKANEQLNLDDLDSESKLVSLKLRENVDSQEIVQEQKNDKNYQVIINCIPESYTFSPKGGAESSEVPVDDDKNNGKENILNKIVGENYDAREGSNNFVNVNEDRSKNSEVKKKVILPEKSLPLKKKAKMKRTLTFDSQRSLLKQELVKIGQLQCKSSFGSKTAELKSSFESQDHHSSDSEESLFIKINKRRKTQELPQKIKNMANLLPGQENKEKPLIEPQKDSCTDSLTFDITKFKSIYDLVEGLRKYRMISVPVWQILNTGLKEMNVDILKEIIKKRKEPKGGNYSPELKAFALVLYFKQPAAFNFLSKVCNGGWPSLNVIKEWKLQLNSHQRPNFIGVQRQAHSDIS